MTKVTLDNHCLAEKLHGVITSLGAAVDSDKRLALQDETRLTLYRLRSLTYETSEIMTAKSESSIDSVTLGELTGMLERIEGYSYLIAWSEELNGHIANVLKDVAVMACECLRQLGEQS